MNKLLGIMVLIFIIIGSFAWAGTLENVRSKNILACGISEGVPGFSIPDSTGKWVGFDVDMARAVAAAVLSDSQKIRFVPLASK